MRELDAKEMEAITGGRSAGFPGMASQQFWPTDPVNPLTVTFGTPVEPGLVLPGDRSGWSF